MEAMAVPPTRIAAQCSGGADGAYVDRGTVYVVVGCSSYLNLAWETGPPRDGPRGGGPWAQW